MKDNQIYKNILNHSLFFIHHELLVDERCFTKLFFWGGIFVGWGQEIFYIMYWNFMVPIIVTRSVNLQKSLITREFIIRNKLSIYK